MAKGSYLGTVLAILATPATAQVTHPPFYLSCELHNAQWGTFERNFIVDEAHSTINDEMAVFTHDSIRYTTRDGNFNLEFYINRLTGKVSAKYQNPLGSPLYFGTCTHSTVRKF